MRTSVSYEEAAAWCTIYYYEMNQRFGDPFQGTGYTVRVVRVISTDRTVPEIKYIFKGKANLVKIDGWTDPSEGDRFCLGVIQNQNRNREVEQVRRNVGNGVELVYELGKVSVKNMSQGKSNRK